MLLRSSDVPVVSIVPKPRSTAGFWVSVWDSSVLPDFSAGEMRGRGALFRLLLLLQGNDN